MGFRQSRRLWVAGEVEGSKSKIDGSKALALGSWCDLGFGFASEVEDWFVGSWVHGAKSLGRRQSRSSWVAGHGLSLSLSLSLFVFQKMIFEGKIKMEIILHPTHGQTEKHFQKMYFPCATKHPHLRKSISENHFHPKQTQPKASPYSLAT